MSLSMFNNLCQNVLKFIGRRVVSFRITLSHVVGGWSLISSSLQFQQKILLQRLHLIDIKPHELDKLLSNHLIKQIHTLLIDVTPSNPFNDLKVEGVYLANVFSQLPLLRICRLPFNHNYEVVNQLGKSSLKLQMILPNLSNTIHLRKLTIGIHTSVFIGRLLRCIPFIENLSFGVDDPSIDENKGFDINSLPAPIDCHHLLYLSRLRIYCTDNISFHRIVTFLSFIFGQFSQLSLKLEIFSSISDPFIILGDTIQKLCIDRLKPCATYFLNLSFYVEDDLEEKTIFISFLKASFIHRQRPKVFIQGCPGYGTTYMYSFVVYTLPYNDTILPTTLFATNLEKQYQMSTNAVDLFPRANELVLISSKEDKSSFPNLAYFKSPIPSLVPWSLLTKISIEEGDVVPAAELEAILRMAYNVRALDLGILSSIVLRRILRNHDNLGTRVNQQIQSLDIDDITLTLGSAQRFCRLLSNQLFNLKQVSFCIYDSYVRFHWGPLSIIDSKNEFTKRIVNMIYFLVDHLQQLVSLHIKFISRTSYETPCFPNLIRQQLHQYPLSRPCRLRCSSEMIQIWL
ncbi:unnamed protein product [Rotaria magnacalcarata]|nr:unnamed protein product [Rotaria magnacalcarata]